MGEQSEILEYRVCWSAMSNASFRGCSDWQEWGGDPDDSGDDVADVLSASSGQFAEGLHEALEASGFEWWVECR